MARTSKPKSAAKVRAPGGAGAILWWLGLGSGGLIVMSPASAAMLLVLLGPVLLLVMVPEDGQGGRIMRASLAFGMAASLHPLRTLWEGGAMLSDALVLAKQPMILFPSWIAIGAGWFIGELAAILLRLVSDLAAMSHRRQLAATLAALEEEWGQLLPPERAGS